MEELPAIDAIDTWIAKAIKVTPISNGLAILIGCTHSFKPDQKHLNGVVTDLRTLQQTFAKLMFTTLFLHDPSKNHLKEVIKCTSELGKNRIVLPETWKRIVVTFSGHGDKDYLFTKDGQIDLHHDVVGPLQAMEAEQLALIPKLFFIDACRGTGVDRGVPVNIRWLHDDLGPVPRGGGNRVPSKGNCYIAYSTLLGMKSFEDRKGGFWMQILSEELVNIDNYDDIIQGVMVKVNKRLIFLCRQRGVFYQQPLCESTLCDEVKLLKEAEALLQQQLGWQQQQQQQQQQQHLLQLSQGAGALMWPPQEVQHQLQPHLPQLGQQEVIYQPLQQAGGDQVQHMHFQQLEGYQAPQHQQLEGYQPLQQLEGYQPPQHRQLEAYQPLQQLEGYQPPQHRQLEGYQPLPHQQLQGYQPLEGCQPPRHQPLEGYQPLPQQELEGYPPALQLQELGYHLPQMAGAGALEGANWFPEDRGPPGSVARDNAADVDGGHSHCALQKKARKAPSCKKAKLEEYFKSKQGDGEAQISYVTKPDSNGYRSTVYCPELGYAEGETKPTEDRAEQSAAKKALERLLS